MEPERQLATSQAMLLRELISKFPAADRISLDYRIAGVTALVMLDADDKTATVQVGETTVEESKGIDSETALQYGNNRNLTTFLRSSSTVLSRWRRICEDTYRRDTMNRTTVTLRYNSSTSEFTCYVRTPIPVDHEISYSYIAVDGRQKKDDIVSERVGDTRIAMWEGEDCNLTTAKCIVRSYAGWSLAAGLNIEDSPGIVARTASGGADVAVSVVAASIFLGLLAFLWYRYRSAVRPLNDLLGLLREGGERLRANGYARGSPC